MARNKLGGILGGPLQRVVDPELVRGMEDPAQHGQVLRLVQLRHGNFVEHGYHAGEVGADPDGAERRYDEQRRRPQVNLVAERLVHGSVQVGVRALELPDEITFQIGISHPVGHPFLEGEGIPVAMGDGRGVFHQGADIQKHLLGRLLLPEVDVAPLRDESLWLHFSASPTGNSVVFDRCLCSSGSCGAGPQAGVLGASI